MEKRINTYLYIYTLQLFCKFKIFNKFYNIENSETKLGNCPCCHIICLYRNIFTVIYYYSKCHSLFDVEILVKF